MYKKVSAVIGFLLVIVLGVSGCSSVTSRKTVANLTTTTIQGTFGQQGNENTLAEMPTSFDLIEKELKEEKITEKEAIHMQLQAAFQPEALPGKYRGAALDTRYGMNYELQWVIDHWETLSEAEKKQFEPYILPLDHANSLFNPAARVKENTFSLIPVVRAVTSDWKYENIQPGGSSTTVTIAYYMPDNEPAEDKSWIQENVTRIKAALNKAWPKYKALLGVEPTKNFTLYMGDISNLALTHGVSNKKLTGVHGFATWGSGENCLIAIEKSLMNEQLDSAVVHELFHCFQFYVGLTSFSSNRDMLWLMEATAVWAEDFIYHDSMTEWDYLDAFFDSVHQDLIIANKKHEYGSYLFFYFLSQHLGNNDYIRDILEDARWGDIPDTITTMVEDYKEVFPVFALYNWNQAPWKKYKDTPTFPDKIPSSAILDCLDMEPAKTEYAEELGKGSIRYMHHVFHEDINKIRKVIFDFSKINIDENISRQALIKVDGAWIFADWNDVAKREFCRKTAGENVQEVILILSNANLSGNAKVTYTVDTGQECTQARAAYMRITQTLRLGSTLSLQAVLESQEVIKYTEDEDIDGYAYKITERHMTFSYQQSNQVTDPDMGFTASVTGNGNLDEVFAMNEEKPTRFVVGHDGDVRFIAGYDSIRTPDWVTYHTAVTSAGITNKYTEAGSPIFNLLDSLMNIELEKNEILPGKIKGKRIQESMDSSGGTLTTTLEFEYDIP
ncbi:MAG TPA: hypothetical protein DD727_08420 [Clostridiales bacterium]|nr:hypothetical protein [Clostridiales bacterium]